jgi:hypothetical protein
LLEDVRSRWFVTHGPGQLPLTARNSLAAAPATSSSPERDRRRRQVEAPIRQRHLPPSFQAYQGMFGASTSSCGSCQA